MPRYVLLTGLAGLLSCASAGAETSVGIVSDYRYRGLSLTGGQNAAHENFVDLFRGQLGTFDGSGDNRRPQLVRAER